MEAREGPGGGPEPPGVPASQDRSVESHGGVAAAVMPAPPDRVGAIMRIGKKRGRPKKYAPDGSLVGPLSLMPISSSPPGEFTLTTSGGTLKRGTGRGKPAWSKMFLRPELGVIGAIPPGVNFVPHIIVVGTGEDITTKIMTFSQQGSRAVCILSATGVISNVTLRQPDSSGGTLTYEGRFELLSLSGSFMPTENGEIRSRSGGISVSLASPDGRVIGGGLAGLLVAACPMQVVVASFMPNSQSEQLAKKPRSESPCMDAPLSTVAPISGIDLDEVHSGVVHHGSGGIPRMSISTSVMRVDHWPQSNSIMDSRNTTDINVSLHTG